MKKTIVLIGVYFVFASITAQVVNYTDVAVIVNTNSPESVEIGNYFKAQREIPDINMVKIQCSTDERVDSAGLFSIVRQVGDYLVNNGIDQSINYLVTTKGIPLIFEGANCDSFPENLKCSAIDSELTLLINHEDQIGKSNGITNPYFDNMDYTFSQSKYNIYLVTRLDAYTVDDVKSLIDRSGPELKVDKKDAQFIFDLAYASDTNAISPLVQVMERGNDLVNSKGWNSVYSPENDIFITDEQHVLGYFSYIYQPSNKNLDYQWLNGSFAFQGIGETAFTFLKEENTYNDLILANLIEEGVCGAAGTVVPYFLSQGTVWPEILFDRQTYGIDLISETNPYFNLAESYFQALKVTSSSHIIVGDPKTSIVLDGFCGDSTIVLKPGATEGKDAAVWSKGVENHGDRESLTAYTWTYNGDLALKRSFLAFDFSSIPEGANITSAKLSLFYNPSDPVESFHYHFGENDLLIQRVTSEWDEHTIVWDNQPATTTEQQVILPPSTDSTQDYLNIDVTEMVIDMINPSTANNGFMIRMVDEINYYKSVLFASSDHTDATLHPEMTICWTLNPASANETEEPELSFEVYPNPNRGSFQIRIPGDESADYKISIFNSTGQRITNYSFGNKQIRLSEKGIFIIIVSDESGNYSAKKIIVL
ncbi:MAG: TIGR03790 family protein [Bacteroidales bacterium]|nr:TIGR03790 family protein [Bacteroidales bacterium]